MLQRDSQADRNVFLRLFRWAGGIALKTINGNSLVGGGNLTISGGGGSWTEAEVDFGSTPVYSKTFTVTDATATGTSKIVVSPSGTVATGRVGDDWEWDAIIFAALPATGTFTLTALAEPGPVVGKRKIFYQIS